MSGEDVPNFQVNSTNWGYFRNFCSFSSCWSSSGSGCFSDSRIDLVTRCYSACFSFFPLSFILHFHNVRNTCNVFSPLFGFIADLFGLHLMPPPGFPPFKISCLVSFTDGCKRLLILVPLKERQKKKHFIFFSLQSFERHHKKTPSGVSPKPKSSTHPFYGQQIRKACWCCQFRSPRPTK